MDQAVFQFTHPVEVRFKDIDIGGHAHHSHALVYFEEARAAYWTTVCGKQGIDGTDYVLAESRIRWHKRVLWPQTLAVGVRVSKLGRKHFHMEYEVRGADNALLISGMTVQVMYDFAQGATKSMSPAVKSAIEAQDGPFGADPG